jgi:hypothetical protein
MMRSRRNPQPTHSGVLLLNVRPDRVNSATFKKHKTLELARLLLGQKHITSQ